MSTDERVLCIPTAHFESVGRFQGFRRCGESERKLLLQPQHYSFQPRSEVETDPSFKQLIPYVVIHHQGQLFHYRRGSAGTEKRLQSLRSIGIGGHISEEDAAGGDDPFFIGMMREVDEEVEIGCSVYAQFLGFINDDRTLVGSVHLGVVHLYTLFGQPDVKPREAALAEPGFATMHQLIQELEQFETWSQFVLMDLYNDPPQ